MDECEECVRLFRAVREHTADKVCQWCGEGETCGKVTELWGNFQAHREGEHGGEGQSQASTD